MSQTVRTGLGLWGAILCSFWLAACSSAQDNSLFSDAKQDVCPPGCTDSLVSDDSQIAIRIMNPTTTLASSDTRVDIGGECYSSLYTRNQIFVTVSSTSGTNYSANYYNVNGSTTTAYCNNGRFDIAVDLSALPASGVFTVQANIIAYDANNGAHTNNSDGISYVTVRR